MKQHSIAILICWYGPFPWYFPYFIHSCSYNPTIDFFIITDNLTSINDKPQNAQILYKTLDAIKETASEKLGFAVSINYPYKLCDFKPAYGFIFSELIKDYDFWGHGDIDVVYGSIRSFMTNDILNTYDIISSRHDYISGTFCLFRNSYHVSTLFLQSKDYRKVFRCADPCCFDECNFLFAELQSGASILDYPENIQSMTYVVKKAEEKGEVKAYFDFIVVEGTPGEIRWSNGKIIYKDLYEAMFYHLVRFKTECKRPKIFNPIPDTFYFTPRKIIANKKGEISSI